MGGICFSKVSHVVDLPSESSFSHKQDFNSCHQCYEELSPMVLRRYQSATVIGESSDVMFGFGNVLIHLTDVRLKEKALDALEKLLLIDPKVQGLAVALENDDNIDWYLEVIPKILMKKPNFRFDLRIKREDLKSKSKAHKTQIYDVFRLFSQWFVSLETLDAIEASSNVKLFLIPNGIEVEIFESSNIKVLAEALNSCDLKNVRDLTVRIPDFWPNVESLFEKCNLLLLQNLTIKSDGSMCQIEELVCLCKLLSRINCFDSLTLMDTIISDEYEDSLTGFKDYDFKDSEGSAFDMIFKENPITITFKCSFRNLNFSGIFKFLNLISYRSLEFSFCNLPEVQSLCLSKLMIRDCTCSLSIKEIDLLHQVQITDLPRFLRSIKIDLGVPVKNWDSFLKNKEFNPSKISSLEVSNTEIHNLCFPNIVETLWRNLTSLEVVWSPNVSSEDLHECVKFFVKIDRIRNLIFRTSHPQPTLSDESVKQLICKRSNLKILGLFMKIETKLSTLFAILSENKSLKAFGSGQKRKVLESIEVDALASIFRKNKSLLSLYCKISLDSEADEKISEDGLALNETLIEMDHKGLPPKALGILLRNRILFVEKRVLALLLWVKQQTRKTKLLDMHCLKIIFQMFDRFGAIDIDLLLK